MEYRFFNAVSSAVSAELLRLVLLSLITLLIFKPMFYNVDIGASVDAYVYHEIIADALEQYRHHIFPVYVGQSLFAFAGTPMGRAPYLLLLAGFLNLITFGKINSLQIQHATIIFSALAGVYLMYFVLVKIGPKQRWLAFAFAILYITCPSILTLIAKLDMYYSFITIPFFPVFVYALVRSYQKNDVLSYVLLSSSLSLIWMSHPSIGFFCTSVCAIFLGLRLFFQPQIFVRLVLTSGLFALLSLWQFMTIISLKMGEYVDMGTIDPANYAKGLIAFYASYFTSTFLPVNLNSSLPTYNQLGYSLWLTLILGVCVAIKRRDNLLNYLLICAFYLIALISPVPYVSKSLWSHFPPAVIGLSSCWPMLRISPILPAFCCFTGMLALCNICPISADKKSRNLVSVVLIILAVCWSCFQAAPFSKYLARHRAPNPAWLLPENIRHRLEYSSGYHHQPLLEGIYEPALYNRLLQADGKELEGYNNNEIMKKTCLLKSNSLKHTMLSDLKISFPKEYNTQNTDALNPLMKLSILPETKYMFCMDMFISNSEGLVSVDGYQHESISTFRADLPTQQTMLIPIFTTEKMEKELTLTLSALRSVNNSKDRVIRLNSFNVKAYDINKLPIQLHSLIPYKVTIKNPIKFSYLETAREFVDGYVALVNGVQYPTRISPTGRVMVPLLPGNNEVELFYVGTPLIRITFYISLFFWISVAIFLIYHMTIRKTPSRLCRLLTYFKVR